MVPLWARPGREAEADPRPGWPILAFIVGRVDPRANRAAQESAPTRSRGHARHDEGADRSRVRLIAVDAGAYASMVEGILGEYERDVARNEAAARVNPGGRKRVVSYR